jgi:hypothetical protein
MAKPCCERDYDSDGNCDRHPAKSPTKSPTQEFVVTFGVGSPLAKYYVVIEAEDEMTARMKMVAAFSGHWASIYPGTKRAALEREWHLQPLDVNWNVGVRLQSNHEELPDDIYQRVYGGPR